MNNLSQLESLPADVKLLIGDFLVGHNNYLKNRTYFQLNRSFRVFEKEFVNSRSAVQKCQFLSGLLRDKKVRGDYDTIPQTIRDQFSESLPQIRELDLSNVTFNQGRPFDNSWLCTPLNDLLHLVGILKRAIKNDIVQLPNVQKVNLVNCNVYDLDIENLTSHPSLQTLMLGATIGALTMGSSSTVELFEGNVRHFEDMNPLLLTLANRDSELSTANFLTDKSFEHIANTFKDLQHLYVEATSVNVQAFDSIGKMKNLRTLFLSLPLYTLDPNLQNRVDVSLEFLLSFQNLRHLFLNYSHISNAQLQTVARLTNLKTLAIFCHSATRLAPISQLKELSTLAITHTSLVDEDLQALYGLKKLKNLCLINIFQNNTLRDTGLSALSSLHNIRTLTLDLQKNSSFLAKLSPLTKLRHLSMRQELTPEDEKALSQFTNLRSLRLGQTAWISFVLSTSISKLLALEELSLQAEMVNTGFQMLENLQKLKTMSIKLHLYNSISEVVLPVLKELPLLNNVNISMHDDFPVPQEEVQRIKATLPNAKFCDLKNGVFRVVCQPDKNTPFDFCANPQQFFHGLIK